MALSILEETHTIDFQNADGKCVLTATATYGPKDMYISFDMKGKEYCSSHLSDVQSAITASLARFNGLIKESNLSFNLTEL